MPIHLVKFHHKPFYEQHIIFSYPCSPFVVSAFRIWAPRQSSPVLLKKSLVIPTYFVTPFSTKRYTTLKPVRISSVRSPSAFNLIALEFFKNGFCNLHLYYFLRYDYSIFQVPSSQRFMACSAWKPMMLSSLTIFLRASKDLLGSYFKE